MSIFRKISLFIICSFFGMSLMAQPASLTKKKNPYKWMFGISWNVIDDNGDAYSRLLDYEDSWNYLYYPSRISVDRYLRKGWSWEAMAAYNEYTASKIINDSTGLEGMFISADFHVKYSFAKMFGNKWFDPYISAGLGVTYREVMDNPITPTVNVAFGANFWFSRRWGMQIQTIGKLGIVEDIYDSNTDYLQHTIGVVYRKDASKRRQNTHKKRYKWTDDKQKFKRKNT